MTPNQFLAAWLKKKRISPAKCNRKLGYQSAYIYQILSKSNPRPVTFELLGRLLVAYGSRGPALAMSALVGIEKANGNSAH